jgi:hypothetical protein
MVMMFYHGVVCEREQAGKKLPAFSRIEMPNGVFSGELAFYNGELALPSGPLAF